MDPVARGVGPSAAQAALDARALALHPEDAKPAEAAQQFEALLVGELLKRAQQPTFGEAPLSGGAAGAMYRDLFADEVAKRMAARGGLGLADAMLRSAGASPPAQETR
jgi:Rod binding domain-containing protein